MTMIEKVARAICEAVNLQKVDPFARMNYSGIIPPMRWDGVARAALEAMREPSDEMIKAVYNTRGTASSVYNSYQAMLDAALAGK